MVIQGTMGKGNDSLHAFTQSTLVSEFKPKVETGYKEE